MNWRDFGIFLIGVLFASAFWILAINAMSVKPEKEFPIGCRQGDVLFESKSKVTYICNALQEWRPRTKTVNTMERGKGG